MVGTLNIQAILSCLQSANFGTRTHCPRQQIWLNLASSATYKKHDLGQITQLLRTRLLTGGRTLPTLWGLLWGTSGLICVRAPWKAQGRGSQFLAPGGTDFVKDNFSTNQGGGGMVSRWIQAHYTYHMQFISNLTPPLIWQGRPGVMAWRGQGPLVENIIYKYQALTLYTVQTAEDLGVFTKGSTTELWTIIQFV